MTGKAWDAVVVAGGRATRMAGRDKLAIDIGGRTMLDRALDALADAAQVVVVGPRRALEHAVVWCREDPPGGGPAAAIAAGLRHVSATTVVVLAGDQPLVSAQVVGRLLDACSEHGAVAVTDDGQPQWLCSAWPTADLRATPLRADASLREVLGRLPWTPVPVTAGDVFDCDTDADVQRVRELVR
jgi:molybdopterin-guanine dinucleotide biosynthesis protein A